MSITLQAEDFVTDGALSSTRFGTGVADFVNTGGRTYSSAAVASTDSATTLTAFDPSTILSASTPKRIRYELDFTLPTSFPASGEIRAGFHALCRSTDRDGLRLVYRRTSGGAATYVELLIARVSGSALSDLSMYLVPVTALAAGATARLRLDVTLNSTNLVAEAFLDGNPAFISTPTTATFNLVTGRSLSAMTASTCYARLIVTTTGTAAPSGGVTASSRTYLDRLRVVDIGSLADVPAFAVEPALVGAPVRTPVVIGPEDDGTVAELTVHPSYVALLVDEWDVTEHPYDGGYVGTAARQTRPRRRVPMRWDALSAANLASIQALRGSAPFSWTNPETAETLRLKWTTDLTEHHVGPSVWAAEAEAVEVFDDA